MKKNKIVNFAESRHSREGGNPEVRDFLTRMDSRLRTSGMTAFERTFYGLAKIKTKTIDIFLVSFILLFPLFFSDGAFSETTGSTGKKDRTYSSPAEVKELLLTIGKKASNFKNLKTDFVQEKDLAMFKKKIMLQGRIYMEKPDRLAWHVDKPVKYSVVITDRSIRQWDEDTNKVQELSLAKNPIFKNVVDQLSVWFSGEYGSLMDDNNVNILQQHPLVVEFIPNEKNIAKKMIRSITITFRDDEKYLKKISISEISGDSTTIEFSNTVLDTKMESSFFEVERV